MRDCMKRYTIPICKIGVQKEMVVYVMSTTVIGGYPKNGNKIIGHLLQMPKWYYAANANWKL